MTNNEIICQKMEGWNILKLNISGQIRDPFVVVVVVIVVVVAAISFPENGSSEMSYLEQEMQQFINKNCNSKEPKKPPQNDVKKPNFKFNNWKT